MPYQVKFKTRAKKEWIKLDNGIKNQFRKKLEKLKFNPEIPKNKLTGFKNRYKIKLKEKGFRLIYEIEKEEITITVIRIGKREKGEVYK